MSRVFLVVAAGILAHSGLATSQQRPVPASSTQAAARPAVGIVMAALDRDLRLIDKTQLTLEERQNCEAAKSLLQRARQLGGAGRRNEADALPLLEAASKHVVPLIKRQLKLDALFAAAADYRSGKVTSAVQTVSESMASNLSAAVRYLEENRSVLAVEYTSLADVSDRALGALCLLETEVAFQGRYDAEDRLQLTKRLMRLADPARLPPRFVERWYMAVAGYLQREGDLVATLLHVQDGVRQFPNDGGVLLVAGMFYEFVALPGVELPTDTPPRVRGDAFVRSYATRDVTPDAPLPDDQIRALAEAKRSGLMRAAQFYRQAVAADGGVAEAHLRLGRVLFLSARSEEALSELRLAARSKDTRICYLAALFLGAVHESAGRLDEASASFEEAVRMCPRCLTGGLALSGAQREGQMLDLSTETLDTAIGRSGPADYWWDYPMGTYWQRDRLLGELRGELR